MDRPQAWVVATPISPLRAIDAIAYIGYYVGMDITLAEAAERLGIPVRTIRTWCLSGRLPSRAVTPRLRLVREADLVGLTRPKKGNPRIAELRAKTLKKALKTGRKNLTKGNLPQLVWVRDRGRVSTGRDLR